MRSHLVALALVLGPACGPRSPYEWSSAVRRVELGGKVGALAGENAGAETRAGGEVRVAIPDVSAPMYAVGVDQDDGDATYVYGAASFYFLLRFGAGGGFAFDRSASQQGPAVHAHVGVPIPLTSGFFMAIAQDRSYFMIEPYILARAVVDGPAGTEFGLQLSFSLSLGIPSDD